MQAVSLRFSPALWRRGRGANLKPRLSQAASLATERPPRNMRLSLHPSLPREVNIQATEVTETLPQALKREPGTRGTYIRLKGVLHPSLCTRRETALINLLITNMMGDAMLRSGFAIDETSTQAITPDQLAEMKKRDMKQAIVERFSYRAKAVSAETKVQSKERSPYWQPVDHVFFSFSRPTSVLAYSCVTERSPGLRSPFWRLFASLQGFLGQFELRTLSVRKPWVLQVHALQSVHDDVGDGQMREPLVIGWNDVPGRMLGAGVVDHVLVRCHVVIPAAPLVQVGF